jgi:hypothetical protein
LTASDPRDLVGAVIGIDELVALIEGRTDPPAAESAYEGRAE